jgi:hypothetical protein
MSLRSGSKIVEAGEARWQVSGFARGMSYVVLLKEWFDLTQVGVLFCSTIRVLHFVMRLRTGLKIVKAESEEFSQKLG